MPLSNSPNPISDSFAACTLIPTFVVFWSPEYKSSFSVACVTGGLQFWGWREKRKTFHFFSRGLNWDLTNKVLFVTNWKFIWSRFQWGSEKPKPNLSQQQIRKRINMMTKLKTSKPLETQENTSDQVKIVFNFASDCLRVWCKFSKPITKWRKVTPLQLRIIIDTQLKTIRKHLDS